ncbi:unnamed protein product [Schistosoma margrebowiei]|uniref:Uncharacterized protein n=1 Tax=Schistosoma margrebowiei TaxID=48269 RepID=A0A183LV54_9TREM|nr:unnamed protein product [Schistosoma margrebowiei]
MKTSTSQNKHGIQSSACMQLNESNFTDDIVFLSHTHKQMKVKTTTVMEASASVRLNIHKGKSNILKYNSKNTNPITLDGETLEQVKTYM